MATRSLGVLTLDLVAKVGGFVQGMDAAERKSAKWRKQVEKDVKKAGKAIAASAVVAAGATALWIRSSINSAAEIENLAKIAGSSTSEFQRYSAGARTVGIENEKLADILKDVNDKVGDFLVTGGGPLADFFEKVAPKIGVTADQFRGLSGPDALGLYVDTLEKAGASEQELTFFMEAIASDATALIPLLKNSGKAMSGFADEAENLGLIISEERINDAKKFNDELGLLGLIVKGAGQDIASDLLPELSALGDELRNPETIKAAADMAKAVVGSFTSIIDGARNVVQFTQWAAESSAAIMNGIASDDLVRLNDEIARLEAMKSSGALDRVVFFGRDGLVSYYNDEELDTELVKIRAAVEAAMANSAPIKIAVEPELVKTPEKSGSGLGIASKAEIKASEDAIKAAGDVQKAINNKISAIERAAAVWGMEADQVELYDLAQKGATKTQIEYTQSVLDTVAGFEKNKEAQESYLQLVKDLRTDEETLTDQLHDRLAVLGAIADITDEERNKNIGRIVESGFQEAPDYAGVDATVGGPAGELGKIDAAESELNEWYQTQLDMLESFRAARADLSARWDEQELVLKAEHEGKLYEIERNRQLVQLAAGEEFFGNMTDAAKVFFGESSKQYRAAFVVEKSFAMAKALMNIPSSYSKAYDAMIGIPYVGPVLAPAAGAVAAAAQVAQAAAIGNIGMAHDGIDSIPKTGSWILEKGERVTTADTSAKLDGVLDDIRQGKNESQQQGQPNFRIINAIEPELMQEYMGSDEGEQIIMNIVRRNGIGQ